MRLLLTGTPVQNNVDELVTLLRFLVADMFLPAENATSGRAKSGCYTAEDDAFLGACVT